jgi:hypothetical protein
MVDSEEEASPVPESMGGNNKYEVHKEEVLRVMVVTVAFQHGLEGISGGGWVDVVVDKSLLNSVGVKILGDFKVTA